MPRNKGTSRKGKPKKEMRSAGFGKALQRSQTKRYVPKENGSSAHGQGMLATGARTIGVHEQTEGEKIRSVLEIDDLSDFLQQAQMSNKDFQSEREQFLNIDNVAQEYVPTGQATAAIIHEDRVAESPQEHFSFQELSVPRRPAWTPGVTTPEELEVMETATFLEWRRGVARREERIAAMSFETHGGGVAGASVTPYEKNIHVWRQLWRVLERSAVVLQIVDARNPLFYLSDDLRTYVTNELGKPMLVLVNKSDFLTERQRKLWSEYFTRKKIDHLFFSAHDEQKKIDKAAAAAKSGEAADISEEPDKLSAGPLGIITPLTRCQLLCALDTFAKDNCCTPDSKYDNRIQYGMVGFPNVGKSSVINVLVGSSKSIHGVVRVAVAAQPGKTKHFQTLLLPDRPDMMLCDCPGLVFPSFVSSTADMIAAGVYPIAQMRDHWPVVALVCARVPRDVLNAHYGIRVPEPTDQDLREKGWTDKRLPPPSGEELLGTYCIARSMLAPASGVPDYQRAARVVVKDYSEGKLLYCHSPPPAEEKSSSPVDEEYQSETLKTAIRNTNNTKKLQKLEQSLEASAAKADPNSDGLDDFDSILGSAEEKKGDKRGKAHKKIKKHGKKGRKLRNSDPYGCHSDPASVLQSGMSGSGVLVSAGKYSSTGYTRPTHAGARAATPMSDGRDRRPGEVR